MSVIGAFNKAYENSIDTDTDLDNAIEESKKIKTISGVDPEEPMTVEYYMSLLKHMAEDQSEQKEDDGFKVVSKKNVKYDRPLQNKEAPLVIGVNYGPCMNDLDCDKQHCTFGHTGQICQERPPVAALKQDCKNPVCFNYYCTYKHNGQSIITRPCIAEFSRPCNYAEKCTRRECKFVHPGQQPKQVVEEPTVIETKKTPAVETKKQDHQRAKSPESKWKKQQVPRLNLGNDFPPLSIAKRNEPVEFKQSAQQPVEVHDVEQIIANKQKITVLPKDIKMPGKFNYTFENTDFDIPFSKFIAQHCYLNSLQQKILRSVWFNGESVLEDRKIAFMRLLDEIIITSTNIVRRYYNVVTENSLEMNEETVTIDTMNVDRFNCKLDDAVNFFKDYPFVQDIWNDGNILLDDRRNMVQTYYVDKIEENVHTLNIIHEAIENMSRVTYSEITRS